MAAIASFLGRTWKRTMPIDLQTPKTFVCQASRHLNERFIKIDKIKMAAIASFSVAHDWLLSELFLFKFPRRNSDLEVGILNSFIYILK